MMKRKFLWLFAGMCVLALGIFLLDFFIPTPAVSQSLYPLTLRSSGGQTLTLSVEHATTEAQREYGLMNRSSVTHGMLFVFDQPQELVFWMKNTLVPLDIAFFTADGAFVSSTTMVPCTADPCVTYPSGGPSLYALEMPEGFLKQHSLGQDWKIVQENAH
jgi:uncharacterized membrane protein (UPF0127 family)